MAKRYWFPAKRYGWGWGFPCAWQGWLVLAAYAVSLAAGGVALFPPSRSLLGFIGYVVALSLALIAICWWKGEPPRWRWGDPDH